MIAIRDNKCSNSTFVDPMANIGGRPDYIFLPVIGGTAVCIGDSNRVVRFRMAGNRTAICFGNAAIFSHTYKIMCLILDQSYFPCTLLERIKCTVFVAFIAQLTNYGNGPLRASAPDF